MATKLPPVDIVIVGMGWTGGILAKELGPTGLKIVVLERGAPRSTQNDFAVPLIRDELRFSQRHDLMMDVSKDTYTIRNKPSETALPMRRLGSFLPGEGVGGAGVHWNGVTWRWPDHELRIRIEIRGALRQELHPGRHAAAGLGRHRRRRSSPTTTSSNTPPASPARPATSRAQIQKERQSVRGSALARLSAAAADSEPRRADVRQDRDGARLPPLQRPTANASQPYTNPDGMKIGQCQYCGFCERFGCEANAKGSPLITVIPVALRNPNVELRTYSWVTKVLKDSTGKKATGVAYVNVLTGEEIEQPADLVILAAYGLSNVHLMLLSGIGKPYDPETQTGVIGKNYAYQAGAGVTLFFEDKSFNPFIATGGWGTSIDDFHTNWNFDRTAHGGIGGAYISVGGSNGRPITYRPVPPRHAAMGLGLEARRPPSGTTARVGDQRLGIGDAEPLQLPRPRPDLHQPLRPAADAHDVRLQGERAEDRPARRGGHRRHRQGDEPDAAWASRRRG